MTESSTHPSAHPTTAPPRPAHPRADALDAFEQRLERLVARAQHQRTDEVREQDAEMERRVHLQAAFEWLADRLHRHEIRPRMEAVARHFERAHLEHLKTPVCTLTVCTLPRSERFPASTTLTLGVVFDPQRLVATLTYHVQTIPVLMELEGQDAIGVELEAPVLEEVAGWLDRRLEQFVATYVRLERDPRYREQGSEHVDPVCGMRVSAASALRLERNGQTHYFCAPACRTRFEADSDRYVDRGRGPA